jgi:hypothetical protein
VERAGWLNPSENSVIAAVVGLAGALILGLSLASMLDPDAKGGRWVGGAMMLGVGACSVIMLALSLVGIPWSRPILALSWVAVTAAAMWSARRLFHGRTAVRPAETNWAALALWVVIAVVFAGYARLATAAPLWEFDFLGNWGLKARAFWEAGGIDWKFLQYPYHRALHPGYPPLLPLFFDFIAAIGGEWEGRWIGLVNVALAAAAVLFYGRIVREESGNGLAAAFGALIFVSLAASPWIGIADGPFVAFATAGLLLIRGKGRSVTAGAVFTGLAALTKNEGLTLIVAAALALVVAGRRRDVVRLWPAALIAAPWLVLKSVYGLGTDLTTGDVLARVRWHFANLETLVDPLVSYSLGRPLFWVGLLLGVVVVAPILWRRERFVLTAVVLQALFYLAAYLASPHDLDWHVRWSWERLVTHLKAPLAAVVVLQLLLVVVRRGEASSDDRSHGVAAVS